MARLELTALGKSYRQPDGSRLEALHALDLTLESGELLAVVGPSGSGKTTLLRLLAGLDNPDSGDVRLDGVPLLPVAAEEREVAMVFQSPALFPHLTARENLALGLRLRGTSRRETDARIEEITRRLRIGDCLDRRPEALSGGERQRVALGRALVRQPRLLLLDEPFSQLDTPLRVELRRDLAALQRSLGVTTLVVTHDQTEAMALGRRVAVLDAGRLQQVAPPRELYHRPANLFVAGFLGSPPANLLRGRLDRSGPVPLFSPGSGTNPPVTVTLPAGLHTAGLPGDIILGLRPEDLRLCEPAAAEARAWDAVVEHVEPAGYETRVVLRTAGHSLTVRAGSGDPLAIAASPGTPAGLAVDWTRAMWFDPASGRRLGD